ncbi:hypothetical protein A4G27_11950 [Mycobacterium kansasii]|nr:hypothetical protein A4G27_11950 [Mycobacterium kansasii]
MAADRRIDAAVAARGKELIRFLFKSNTVDATIAPEGGGLIFYWASLNMAITIEIYPYSGYWWSARSIAGRSFSGEGTELPLIELQYQLNHFSKEVERQSPNWRSIVR